MTKATAVVAYDYQAETYCPECVVQKVTRARGAYDRSPEKALDQIATRDRIDRYDERTYDSSEFPKVVFASQIEGHEICASCEVAL